MAIAVPVSAAAGADVEVKSQLPDILSAAMTTLPEGPRPLRQNDNCQASIIDPMTAAGRYVQDRGWGIVSEMPLGRFQLVSFGGEFIAGTSGSCAIRQGNIGVFEGGELRAILYTGMKSDELIGQLRAKEGGEIRLWSGTFLPYPVADLEALTHAVVVKALASAESFCDGRASVPNVYGLPITEAREVLKAAGWQPIPQEREDWGQQLDLQSLGVTEAVTCSGTGFAYCSYAYRAQEASLALTTAGELYEDNIPSVAFYEVTCDQ